jgi:malonate-semialdehyde dehydrogenase (acetylating)/methylmalonate-semialdehyde dehydrogenase
VDSAVQAAKEAFESWRAMSLSKRTAIFFQIRELVHERHEEIARILTAEHGKVLSDAMGEVARGLEVIEYCCGIPELLKGEFSEQASTGIDVYSIRQPVGVVAGITRSTFRQWSRCGCGLPRLPAATRSCSSRRRRSRRRLSTPLSC